MLGPDENFDVLTEINKGSIFSFNVYKNMQVQIDA